MFIAAGSKDAIFFTPQPTVLLGFHVLLLVAVYAVTLGHVWLVSMLH